VAAALVAHQGRLRGTPFGEFDGLLYDGAAILEIDRVFGPNFRFSPSQLETYLACPFQFFSKYVLKLKVREERDELDEDLTERGSQLHDILDNFEKLAQQMTTAQTLEDLREIQLRQLAEHEPAGATELDLGLWEIERERLARVFEQYLIQRQEYHRDGALPFLPAKLELDFGGDGAIEPVLKLDNRGRQVLIRGRIDRIDVAATADGLRFRIIDYKSGSAPSALDVKQGAMLQLPLYAMAVQQFLFPGEQAELFDLGYWSLKGGGFKPIAFSTWEQDQRTLMEHVLTMVDQLRRGEFVIQSRKVNCENYCEFRGVCRVRQVRRAGKRHEIKLPELSASSPRRMRGRVAGDSGGAGDSI